MEILIVAGAMAAFLLVMFLSGMIQQHKNIKRTKERLRTRYGDLRKKEYKPEDFRRIQQYFKHHIPEAEEQETPFFLDDITWNDLEMDRIFAFINRTGSSAGEEMLYHILRTPELGSDERKKHFSKLADEIRNDTELRVKLGIIMWRLGYSGKYSLYDYLDHLDAVAESSMVKLILTDVLYIPLIVLLFFQPAVAGVGLLVLTVFNIIDYYAKKADVDPFIASFAYIMKLAQAADEICKIDNNLMKEDIEVLRNANKQLNRFRRGSFWVMSPSRMNSSGSPLDMLADFVRMAFHVDIIKFQTMLKQVRVHIKDVDTLFRIIGSLDAAFAVGGYREYTNGAYCEPCFLPDSSKPSFEMEEGYHPLITNPVCNSVKAEKGVLLTGSNASGKSTFLKTSALCAVLAQTVYTVPAKYYKAPMYAVFTSMALRDDLLGGESYYIVEIRSLKRILEYRGQAPVLCFVDEVLRGTNTVERIAASTEILKSIAKENALCFAATHDIELTSLLIQEYCMYHFEEQVTDDDVLFDYTLRTGKSTTRNAIRLLDLLGFDETVTTGATERAEYFTSTGNWR